MHERFSPLGLRASPWIVVLLVIATVSMARGPGTIDAPMRRDGCRYGAWSTARRLEQPASLWVATRFAGLASIEGPPAEPRIAYTVGVAGSPALPAVDGASKMQWPPQLRAFRLDGRSWAAPTGGFWYLYPRAAMDASGTLHVVWAEPDQKLPATPTILDGAPLAQSVWHATLRGGRWSRPRRIHRALRLEWDDVNTTRLIVDDRGGLHIAFVAADSSGPAIWYLRSDGEFAGGWRATKAVQSSGVYLDLAVDRERSAAIAFVQGGGASRPRANVLFLARSSSDGSIWTRPTEVTTPDEDPAIEPHLFADADGALRLLWVQQPTGEFSGGKIWHTTIADAGRRATIALDLPSSVMTSHSVAAIDACGTIHVMTQWYLNETSELRYAHVTAEGWSTWNRPFDGPGAHASLESDAAALHAVWNVSGRSPADGVLRSALAYAALPIIRAAPVSGRH